MLCGIAHMQTQEGIWYPVGGTRAVPVALAKLAGEPAAAPSLTVSAVDELLTELAGTGGAGSVARRDGLVTALMTAATADEQHFLVRLLTGELRQGALEGVVLDAVAAAADVPADHSDALADAETIANGLGSSKLETYAKLVAGGASEAAAQYAVDTVDADWQANAVRKAKAYAADGMTGDVLRNQLVSEYGEQFTAEEADYALAHLDD